MYSSDQCLIPNIRAEFTHFGLKIAEHSAKLPDIAREDVEEILKTITPIYTKSQMAEHLHELS